MFLGFILSQTPNFSSPFQSEPLPRPSMCEGHQLTRLSRLCGG